MARQKKSRKVGKIGVSKTPSNARKPAEKRVKKPLGKPAGSRNSEMLTTQQPQINKVNKDPRHGSKKPVSLVAEQKPQPAKEKKPSYFSPAQELATIEKDPRLASLLEKQDLGKAISKADQQYLDSTLSRHKELCELLGISEESDESESSTEQSDDLFNQFESIDINDYKN